MLVLTRRLGETIVIDNNVRVTIVSVGPGRVKIGIDAPPTVRIDREEIHDRIANEQAAEAPAADGDALKLHNRIADKLPPAPAPVEAAAAAPAARSEGIARFRRKPR